MSTLLTQNQPRVATPAGRVGCRLFLRLAFALFLVPIGAAAAVAFEPAGPVSSAPPQQPAAQRLAARIDEHIEKRWQAQNAVPAPPADDAEWFRRVYLDIAGKIPPVSELRAFLKDDAPDKRQRAVDRLLESPRYLVNFTTMWRNALIPEAAADPQLRFLIPEFEAWLRTKLAVNAGYAEMAYEILTAPLDVDRRVRNDRPAEPTPIAFYQAKRVQPENLAAGTAQVFLGVRIDCAQCHDHPFDSWKQEQFWELAAFYASVEGRDNAGDGVPGLFREAADRRTIAIPDTERVVEATFLDGSRPSWGASPTPRRLLADWVVSRENPYFARAAANRLWGHFFGTGLVHPVDDFGPGNPPSHPELLDELAQELAAHDFDLKFLIRAITASRAYQLSSQRTGGGQDDGQLFARMALKGLTPEQLLDSLAEATGIHRPFNPNDALTVGAGNANPRAELMETFANDSEEPTARTTTILQALAMMNGPLTAEATELETSEALAAIADFPLLDTAGRIEALFLAVLSRKPHGGERRRLVEYVEGGGPLNDKQQALADVYWALLNSSEFLFNH